MESVMYALISKLIDGKKKRVVEVHKGADWESEFKNLGHRGDDSTLIEIKGYDDYILSAYGVGGFYSVMYHEPDGSIGKLLVQAESEKYIRANFIELVSEYVSTDAVVLESVDVEDIDIIQFYI